MFIKFLKNLSVINKILFVIALNIPVFIILSLMCFRGLSDTELIKNQIVENSEAAVNQLTADMMRGALRADVYSALMVDSGDTKNSEMILMDFNEHVSIFKSSLASLDNSDVSPVIKNQSIKMRGPLDAYIANVSKIITTSLDKTVDYKSIEGKKELENFKIVFDKLAVEMEALTNVISDQTILIKDQSTAVMHTMKITILVLLMVMIIFSAVGVYVAKMIAKPIALTEEVLSKLSMGEITAVVPVDSTDDTGRMLNSLNTVISNMSNVKEYVTAVGNGNFDNHITVFENQGDIYDSLAKMKKDLKFTAEEDHKRNWTTEGLAHFADILRGNALDIADLSNTVLTNLVKYLNANQGGLFVVNDIDPNDCYLELMACYAWDKKKYLNKRVDVGEGLVGQVWQEADLVYISDIPDNFVSITSGLGNANPHYLLIVPLTVNGETFGVIEIASFKHIEDYKIEFIKKLAESIATTLSGTKINDKTKILLAQSQSQTEQMRAQEEEMRQNMEEMLATQEEMERKEAEMQQMVNKVMQQEEALRQTLEEVKASSEELERSNHQMKKLNDEVTLRDFVFGLTTILSESDLFGNVTYANQKLVDVSKYSMVEIMGKPHNMFRHPDMPKEIFKMMWDTLQAGKVFKGIVKNKAKDGTPYWIDGCFVPVKDDNGVIVKYIGARYHIADAEIAQKMYDEQMRKLNL
jgi:methyl-accepting chemotaxis protein